MYNPPPFIEDLRQPSFNLFKTQGSIQTNEDYIFHLQGKTKVAKLGSKNRNIIFSRLHTKLLTVVIQIFPVKYAMSKFITDPCRLNSLPMVYS